VTIKHSLILGFFSILCSCTTRCAVVKAPTVGHQINWQRSTKSGESSNVLKIYLRFGQHTVLRIIYKLQCKFRNWRRLASALKEKFALWVQGSDFGYHVCIVFAKFATQRTVSAWLRITFLLLVRSFSVHQWSVVSGVPNRGYSYPQGVRDWTPRGTKILRSQSSLYISYRAIYISKIFWGY